MKNKGFTLVELLAVIAILAIIVIFALPNVLEMYNRAKKELFLTEAKTIYKETSKKYISETMRGNKITKISSDGNKLNLESNGMEYSIRLDSNGIIKYFFVSNGTYCISGRYNNLSELNINEVKDKDCEKDNYQENEVFCQFDGQLVQGAEFKRGMYTYRYKQEMMPSENESIAWKDMNDDGWGVQLTDKTSTNKVSGDVCTYINDKPVISMKGTFYGSQATSIDLSNFYTNNITNMDGMFANTMFSTLDLSSFDTSKVVSMVSMFLYSGATSINLSSFNTSKVNNMTDMFYNSMAMSLDLSSFDTSNVTDMSGMFAQSYAISINLSSFNTSKVTKMPCMFIFTDVKELDLSSFDTSNVTDMHRMFMNSDATKINLSSFNTKNVTSMYGMFLGSYAEILDLSSFDIDSNTNIWGMFSSITRTTTGYAKNSEIAALLNDASVTDIPDTLKFVVK